MRISKIKIQNFRSIKSADIEVGPFNIFIGQNNSGKTNIFEAIEFFFNGYKGDIKNLIYNRNTDVEMYVEVEFSDVQGGLGVMQNEKNKSTLRTKIGESERVAIRRSSSDAKKRKLFICGNEVSPGTGFDTALNDFLPKFEYITTKQYYDSVAKYAKTTPIGIMLSNVLNEILKKNQKYNEFQDKFAELFDGEDSEIKAEFDSIGGIVKLYLEKQFPDTTLVRFEVTPPAFDDLLKNFNTAVDDGVETLAEEKGDGMQRALMLAIIQAYSKYRKENEEKGKSFIFFIDEAELHLHPRAQRNLKEVLLEISQDSDQVFINTHSSVLVADDDSNQFMFKVEKNEGETCICYTTSEDKPYIVYDLLGGSPADLLLPSNFLIVEGKSEFELLRRVIKRFYHTKPNIHIITALGDVDQAERTINSIEKAYIPLGCSIYRDRLVVLMDHPSHQTEGGVKEFKKKYKHMEENNQIFTLDERDIEQCYPMRTSDNYGTWRKTQDEVDAMSSKRKVKLAQHVGDNITKQEFETSLKVCYKALERCWQLAFSPSREGESDVDVT